MRIYSHIQNPDFVIEYLDGVSESARDIIGGLMTHHQLQRLGCRQGGANDVREHDWFSGFDFEKLLAGGITSQIRISD